MWCCSLGLLFFGRWTRALRSLPSGSQGRLVTCSGPAESPPGWVFERLHPEGISGTASNRSAESLNHSHTQKTSQNSLRCKSIFSLLSCLRLRVWTAIPLDPCWFTGSPDFVMCSPAGLPGINRRRGWLQVATSPERIWKSASWWGEVILITQWV